MVFCKRVLELKLGFGGIFLFLGMLLEFAFGHGKRRVFLMAFLGGCDF